MDAKVLQNVTEAIKPINDALKALLIKGSSEANESNVKAAVRSLQPNEKLDLIMNKMYVTASNLLTVSTQYLVTKSLFTHLFAEKGRSMKY